MPRIRHIENAPAFEWNPLQTLKKQACREEQSLSLDDPRVAFLSDSLQMQYPLRFASLVRAYPTCQGSHMDFHTDSADPDRKNVLVYLRDVETEEDGPLEFQEEGSVLGKRGTAIEFFSSKEFHRGRANRSSQPRDLLAMAFYPQSRAIDTIGANCGYDIRSASFYNTTDTTFLTFYVPASGGYGLTAAELVSVQASATVNISEISVVDGTVTTNLLGDVTVSNFFNNEVVEFASPSFTTASSLVVYGTFYYDLGTATQASLCEASSPALYLSQSVPIPPTPIDVTSSSASTVALVAALCICGVVLFLVILNLMSRG